MPEIRELLHDAAPTPRPYEESAVRSRVATRRRRRRVLSGAAVVLALALAGGIAAVVGRDDPDDQTVVAQPGPEVQKQAGITAVAVAGDDLIIGDESGSIGPEDRFYGVAAPGPVRRIEVGEEIWAAGDTWVGAIDVAGVSFGFWDAGGTVADVQPLEDRHAAVSLPDDDAIAVVRATEDGVEEVTRIPVGAEPTALVLTRDGELWVSDGEVICRIDWRAGTAVDEQTWPGALLAPSASGGIWAVEGDRVVDLRPALLNQGQSVAVGARYDHPGATLAVSAGDRLYVAGPSGIVQYAMNDQLGMPITDHEPVAMAIDGDGLVYVVGGAVHRFEPEDRGDAGRAASAFVVDVLGWGPHAIGSPEVWDGRTLTATLAGSDREAELTMAQVDGEWQVTGLWTFGDGPVDSGASVSLGNADGADSVSHVHEEEGLTPELTVRYGDHETVLTAPDERAWWEGDLGFVPDTPGWIQILWRNADGVALEGWREPLPAGPYNMG